VTTPVAGPVSAALALSAAGDKLVHDGKLSVSEIVVTGVSLVPGAKAAGEALTGVKEVGEVLHQGQHALHAASSALEVGAVYLEKHEHEREASHESRSRHQPGTAAWLSPPSFNFGATYASGSVLEFRIGMNRHERRLPEQTQRLVQCGSPKRRSW